MRTNNATTCSTVDCLWSCCIAADSATLCCETSAQSRSSQPQHRLMCASNRKANESMLDHRQRSLCIARGLRSWQNSLRLIFQRSLRMLFSDRQSEKILPYVSLAKENVNHVPGKEHFSDPQLCLFRPSFNFPSPVPPSFPLLRPI